MLQVTTTSKYVCLYITHNIQKSVQVAYWLFTNNSIKFTENKRVIFEVCVACLDQIKAV